MINPAKTSPHLEDAAALLLIGDELLSGRTRDANLAFIAEKLAERGIDLAEARIVADEEEAIIAALNALRARYHWVFTTGGIGPTHDDITAAAVAKAFGLPLIRHPDALAVLEALYARRKIPLNPARLRMANMPEGAILIENSVSGAPGFQIGNVFVMAGIPQVMHAMMESLLPRLPTRPLIRSRTLEKQGGEGGIATALASIQRQFPDVKIGSYPSVTPEGLLVRIVLRSRDESRLNAAFHAVEAII